MKVARNEKRKKLLGFSFYINIGNFEAFLRNLNSSTKHLFWRCETFYTSAQRTFLKPDNATSLLSFKIIHRFIAPPLFRFQSCLGKRKKCNNQRRDTVYTCKSVCVLFQLERGTF